jgi:hypothetical protein
MADPAPYEHPPTVEPERLREMGEELPAGKSHGVEQGQKRPRRSGPKLRVTITPSDHRRVTTQGREALLVDQLTRAEPSRRLSPAPARCITITSSRPSNSQSSHSARPAAPGTPRGSAVAYINTHVRHSKKERKAPSSQWVVHQDLSRVAVGCGRTRRGPSSRRSERGVHHPPFASHEREMSETADRLPQIER